MNQFCILNYYSSILVFLLALPEIQNTSIVICETCCMVLIYNNDFYTHQIKNTTKFASGTVRTDGFNSLIIFINSKCYNSLVKIMKIANTSLEMSASLVLSVIK